MFNMYWNIGKDSSYRTIQLFQVFFIVSNSFTV